MNRDDILLDLAKIDEIGLSRDDYMITYGAAMVLHGLKRDTNDIDINVDKKGINFLMGEGFEFKPYNGDASVLYFKLTDRVDAFFRSSLANPYGVRTKRIDGYRVMTLISLMREFKARGREKDLENYKILEAWRRR